MIVVDPRLNKIEILHSQFLCCAAYSYHESDLYTNYQNETTLYDIAITANGAVKLELVEHNNGNYIFKTIATLMIDKNHGTFIYDLGITLPIGSTARVRVTNLDRSSQDIFVMLRYSTEDLYSKYSREFTKALEAQLDQE